MLQRQGAVAVFVKTPGYSPLKTRLAQSVGTMRAEQFHVLSAKAVAAVVQKVSQQKLVTPFWAVAEPEAVQHSLWSQFETIDQGTGGLGARLAHVQQQLLASFDFVIFLGADTPQLPVNLLHEAVEFLALESDTPQFVIGPACDGGFYLFGSQIALDSKIWLNVPYSIENTACVLREQIQELGEIHLLPELSDVDTIQDLPLVARQLSTGEGWLEEQRQVLNWIQEWETQSD
ncbi:TIGR04282 family arsenosugar biosynthesis glycosyltransferase [Gimesia sp.]|uniref:TIGR04282 family arsenosugar biosynthesis glycosyltransferase n=1 Tax=Gimesia sp. TaxID=2024833 RepID=UPI003A8CB084